MHISPNKVKNWIFIVAVIVVVLMYVKTGDFDKSLEYGGLLVVLLYIIIYYYYYILYLCYQYSSLQL